MGFEKDSVPLAACMLCLRTDGMNAEFRLAIKYLATILPFAQAMRSASASGISDMGVNDMIVKVFCSLVRAGKMVAINQALRGSLRHHSLSAAFPLASTRAA